MVPTLTTNHSYTLTLYIALQQMARARAMEESDRRALQRWLEKGVVQ